VRVARAEGALEQAQSDLARQRARAATLMRERQGMLDVLVGERMSCSRGLTGGGKMEGPRGGSPCARAQWAPDSREQ